MKILQMDVDSITFEPIKPEASLYDDVKKEKTVVNNTLVILTSVENGDTIEMADKAMQDTFEFMKKLARTSLVIYPFAHLSGNLAAPKDAMQILEYMYKHVPENITVVKAPFGWNKKLILDIKAQKNDM